MVALLVPLGQVLGVDQVHRAQQVGVHRGIGVQDLQHALRVLLARLLLLGLQGVLAQQLGGLVEQRDVGHRPRPADLAVELRDTQLRAAVRGLVELGQQPARGEGGPQHVDGGAQLAVGVQLPAHVRGHAVPRLVDLGQRHVQQHVHQRLVEDDAGVVVQQPGLPGAGAGHFGDGGVEVDDAVLQLDRDGLGGQLLALRDGGGEQVQDPETALAALDLRDVLADGAEPGHEVAGRGEHDVGLPQRRQHVADVAEEPGVRAHDQHAPLGQAFALGVEQVGDAVQRDGGLAGAGTALHDQDAGVVEADDLVLLDLDRGDDVAHDLLARRVQRGRQRDAVQPQLVVVEVLQAAAAGVEVPPPGQSFGDGGGRHVERAGGGGAPVREQGLVLVLLVEQPHPADVGAGAVDVVGAAEAEPVVGDPQPAELVGQRPHGHLALPALGGRVAQGLLQRAQCDGPLGVELAVQECDAFTFREQFLHVVACPFAVLQ